MTEETVKNTRQLTVFLIFRFFFLTYATFFLSFPDLISCCLHVPVCVADQRYINLSSLCGDAGVISQPLNAVLKEKH